MPGGRAPALNAERQRVILDAIRTGATEARAASYGGVHLDTVRAWRRRGEAALQLRAGLRNPSQRLYAEFVTSLDRALAETAVRMQGIVMDIALRGRRTIEQVDELDDEGRATGRTVERRYDPTPEQQRISLQAATWWLSHRERADYSTRAEVTGADGGAIELSADEAWRRIVELTGRESAEPEAADDELDDDDEVEVR